MSERDGGDESGDEQQSRMKPCQQRRTKAGKLWHKNENVQLIWAKIKTCSELEGGRLKETISGSVWLSGRKSFFIYFLIFYPIKIYKINFKSSLVVWVNTVQIEPQWLNIMKDKLLFYFLKLYLLVKRPDFVPLHVDHRPRPTLKKYTKKYIFSQLYQQIKLYS